MINMGRTWNNIVEETVWVGKMHTCETGGRSKVFDGFCMVRSWEMFKPMLYNQK